MKDNRYNFKHGRLLLSPLAILAYYDGRGRVVCNSAVNRFRKRSRGACNCTNNKNGAGRQKELPLSVSHSINCCSTKWARSAIKRVRFR